LGLILAFSAFVKLNDPLGFAYKLEEYFSHDVLNMPFFIPFSLYFSIFISLVEGYIAVAIISKFKYRKALVLSVLMFVFFGFLTFYSAYFDKVKDCGCFGEVIKFKPWGSFAKDIVLLLITFILFAEKLPQKRRRLSRKKVSYSGFSLFFIGAVIFTIIPIYSLTNLPIVDFSSFKIGVDIQKDMEIPENAEMDQYEQKWIYKVDGVEKEFTDEQEPWNIKGAEFVSRESILVKEGFRPKIEDFALFENEIDITSEILSLDEVTLVFSSDLNKLSDKNIADIENLNNNFNLYFVSSASKEELQSFKNKFNDALRCLSIDHTICKTVIRANPGVLRLKKGTIIKKYDL
jgi:hypothetical protein